MSLERVAAELSDVRPVNVRDAVRSVMKTLESHVTAGEIDDVKSQLPESIRRLWPAKKGAKAPAVEPAYARAFPNRED